MLMMKKPKNLEFEPLHPKNVLLAFMVHGISCLFRNFSAIQKAEKYHNSKISKKRKRDYIDNADYIDCDDNIDSRTILL
jgi:hypothetical protein